MVFKRRDKPGVRQWIAEAFYPRGGWRRAGSYVWHRLRRLPDTPHKIARGIAVGVFISFTPFFGFHLFLAAGLALLIRGNVVAALLATFVGNPLTFPLIAGGSLSLGHKILGRGTDPAAQKSVLNLFGKASADLWHHFKALFGGADVDWSGLIAFFHHVFVPYLVGGLVPGLIGAIVCYVLSLQVISAYQKSRRMRLLARWKDRRARKQDRN